VTGQFDQPIANRPEPGRIGAARRLLSPAPMQLARCSGFLLALCTAGSLAHADGDADAAQGARSDIQQFAYSVWDATKHGMFGNNFYRPAAECTAAVERGNKAGLKATDTYEDGDNNAVLWKHAPEVCADYARFAALSTVIDAIHPQLETVEAFSGADGKPDPSVTGDAFRETAKVAKTCVDTIDKAIKAGVVTDVAFAPNGNEHDTLITLTQARTLCSNFVDFSGKAAVADDKRQAEATAALREKWGKLGITGDRLKYLVENDTHTILGKGCVELDNKGKKSSSVFYEVYSDDSSWIVYKTQFKKDKQTKTSNRRFRRDGGYSCK
jgi:hypothetical protein